MACLKCKQERNADTNVFSFHVLEVQTLRIRDMSGEKRVQALGKFQDYEVCRPCAEEQLHAVCSPGKSVLSRCAVFGGIFLLGVFVSVLFRSGAAQIRFFGVAAMICGALGIYEAIRNARRHRLEYQAMSDQDALQEAAWEVLLANAPKKSEDSDLSYIPVDKRTLAMKKGDLMNVYDLLPEIAVKAYDLIRSGD